MPVAKKPYNELDRKIKNEKTAKQVDSLKKELTKKIPNFKKKGK